MVYNSYQIADILGVNVSTIKRWTDSGKLKCEQTIGGHRKFHLSHLAELVKSDKKISKNINFENLIGKNNSLILAIDSKDEKKLINYSYRNLIGGKTENFLSLNNSLILKGYSISTIYDKILLPVLIKIGNRWSKGKLTISEEHLASQIIKKFLSNLSFGIIPKKTKYNAFCFTLINDKHDIPLLMGESLLNQNEQIKTFNLGPNLPVEDFITLSQKTYPDIIYVSVVYIDNINILNQQINLLCKYFSNLNTKIFLSGSGFKQLRINYTNFTEIQSFEYFENEINSIFI